MLGQPPAGCPAAVLCSTFYTHVLLALLSCKASMLGAIFVGIFCLVELLALGLLMRLSIQQCLGQL